MAYVLDANVFIQAKLAHGATVVTHETSAASAKKVKIPNVCIGLGIKCVTPYAMLRHERARFVLGSVTP